MLGAVALASLAALASRAFRRCSDRLLANARTHRARRGRTPTRSSPSSPKSSAGTGSLATSRASTSHFRREIRARAAIYADTYGDAGALDFFGPRYGLPPAISSQNNYYLWGTRDYDGSTLVAIGATRIDLLRRFYRSVTLVRTSSEPYKWIVEGPAPIYLCRDPDRAASADMAGATLVRRVTARSTTRHGRRNDDGLAGLRTVDAIEYGLGDLVDRRDAPLRIRHRRAVRAPPLRCAPVSRRRCLRSPAPSCSVSVYPGQIGVYRYAGSLELGGDRSRKADDAVLARAIGRNVRRADKPGGARDVDDTAPLRRRSCLRRPRARRETCR